MPGSGIVSRYSTISPFSVRGPLVGSVQPIRRLSARTLAAAFTTKRAAGLAEHVLVQRGRIGRELAHDLLEQVLERHEPQHVAVFVDDECEPATLLLELQQLLVQRRALGHVVGLAATRERAELLAVQLAARQQSVRPSSCAGCPTR